MEPKIGGIYAHFKDLGKHYKVIGIGMDTETQEDVVIYQPLYENPSAAFFVRPLAMFSGDVERDGKKQPRFSEVKE